jgi:DNA-binding CsgD family transcriptional regulator
LRRELGAGFAARVAVFIRELGDTAPFPAELFVRRYGITPAESRVMQLLVQGMTPADAAEALGISLPTARTHLARLLDKTGTSRQADLVRLAMSALAPTAAT